MPAQWRKQNHRVGTLIYPCSLYHSSCCSNLAPLDCVNDFIILVYLLMRQINIHSRYPLLCIRMHMDIVRSVHPAIFRLCVLLSGIRTCILKRWFRPHLACDSSIRIHDRKAKRQIDISASLIRSSIFLDFDSICFGRSSQAYRPAPADDRSKDFRLRDWLSRRR